MSRSSATFRIGASLFLNPAGVLPDATVVTKALGIEPTRSHNAGEAHGSLRPIPWKHGQWALESQLPEASELEAHLDWLLARLLPVRDRVLTVLAADQRLRASFFCGLWMSNENEGLELSPRLLEGISSLSAELDLDIYYEGDSPEAD